MAEKEEAPKKSSHILKRTLIGLLGILLIAAIAGCVYLYRQYTMSQQLLQNPTLAQQEQTNTLLTQIGKLIQLPSNETPQIATVSDVSKLSGQPFFASAQNGDKLLIYPNAKEAILYRPSENKIIAVGPVNTAPTITPTPTPTRRVKRVTAK